LGNGDGTFGTPTKFPAGPRPNVLAVGDFNGDAKPDLAIGNFNSVAILAGNGNGTFAAPVSVPVGQSMYSLLAVDITGDGVLDLAALDTQDLMGDKVWVLPGNGNGTFGQPVGTSVHSAAGSLSYTDLNHDGKPAATLYQNLLNRAPSAQETNTANQAELASWFQALIGYPANVTPVSTPNNEFQNTGTYSTGPDHICRWSTT